MAGEAAHCRGSRPKGALNPNPNPNRPKGVTDDAGLAQLCSAVEADLNPLTKYVGSLVSGSRHGRRRCTAAAFVI